MCISVCDIPITMSMHPLQIIVQLLAHPSRGGMTTTKSLEDFGMGPLVSYGKKARDWTMQYITGW